MEKLKAQPWLDGLKAEVLEAYRNTNKPVVVIGANAQVLHGIEAAKTIPATKKSQECSLIFTAIDRLTFDASDAPEELEALRQFGWLAG